MRTSTDSARWARSVIQAVRTKPDVPLMVWNPRKTVLIATWSCGSASSSSRAASAGLGDEVRQQVALSVGGDQLYLAFVKRNGAGYGGRMRDRRRRGCVSHRRGGRRRVRDLCLALRLNAGRRGRGALLEHLHRLLDAVAGIGQAVRVAVHRVHNAPEGAADQLLDWWRPARLVRN